MTWIKTDDCLPSDFQYCWLYLEDKYVTTGWYNFVDLGFWEGSVFNGIDRVTHWQPYFTPVAPSDEEGLNYSPSDRKRAIDVSEMKKKLIRDFPQLRANIELCFPDENWEKVTN